MAGNVESKIILSAIDRTKNAFNAVEQKLGGIERASHGMSRALKLASAAFGGFAAGAAITSTVRQFSTFEASISDLSALTGATGRDLDFMSDKAREFGATTGFAANEVAEAFKLVASAKPDLLANAEALSQVTKEALILANAAGIGVPEAANALGLALNQFGADADQAGEFINVMAASAQLGSAEIVDIAESLKNAGVAAKLSNVSFVETNAALQALGKAGLKGAEAGTGLRAVLLKLQNQANDQFNPAVVGINQALDNLAAAQFSNKDLMKLFGLESFKTGAALIEQREVVRSLSDQLSGTNTAYEQAATKMDNLKGDSRLLRAALIDLQIELGEGTGGALRELTQLATFTINEFKDFTKEVKNNEDAVIDWGDTVGTIVAGVLDIMSTGFTTAGNLLGQVALELAGSGATAMALLSGDFREAKAIQAELNSDLSRLQDQLINQNTSKFRDFLKERRKALEDQRGFAETLQAEIDAGGILTFDETPADKSKTGSGGLVDKELSDEEKAAQRRIDARKKEVESLLDSLATDAEAREQKFSDDQARLEKALSDRDITIATFQAAELRLLEKFEEDKRKIRDKEDAEVQKVRDRSEERLQAILEGFATETEQREIKLTEQLDSLDEWFQLNLDKEAEFQQLRALIIQQAELDIAKIKEDARVEQDKKDEEARNKKLEDLAELTGIQKQMVEDFANFQNLGLQGQLSTVADFGTQITSLFAGTSKKAFDLNKKFQIAQAIVNTAAGAAAALAPPPLGLGPVAGIPLAALVVAQGAAKIASIRSASPGGGSLPGSSGGGLGGGGASFAGSSQNVGDTDIGRSGVSAINITLNGRKFDREDVQEILEQINELSGDNARISIQAAN